MTISKKILIVCSYIFLFLSLFLVFKDPSIINITIMAGAIGNLIYFKYF